MLKIAFSTVACPEWPLTRVAEAAARYGFDGVELRSMGHGGTEFACDPGLTHPEKVRQILDEAGIAPCGVATGCAFDAPVNPPVVGHLLGLENRLVGAGKHMIDVAHDIGAGYVRVFGFQVPKGERRHRTLRRIVDRLALLCTHARHRDVAVLIENGGDFPGAQDLSEIIERVGNPLLGACYDIEAGAAVGDAPELAPRLLGRHLHAARIKDSFGGRPCRLGEGGAPCREFLAALRDSGQNAWVVYAWDRAWLPELSPADEMLPHAASKLAEWTASRASARAAAGAA